MRLICPCNNNLAWRPGYSPLNTDSLYVGYPYWDLAMQFTMPDLPPNMEIVKAEINLYRTAVSGTSTGYDIRVYRCGFDFPVSEPYITWPYGELFKTESVQKFTSGWNAIDITDSLVYDYAEGKIPVSNGYIIDLYAPTQISVTHTFAGRTYTDETLRPYLSIDIASSYELDVTTLVTYGDVIKARFVPIITSYYEHYDSIAFDWDLDIMTSTEQQPEMNVLWGSQYDISCSVNRDGLIKTATESLFLRYEDEDILRFTLANNYGPAPLTVTMTNTSTIVNYIPKHVMWRLDDEAVDTGDVGHVTIKERGVYDITMFVLNEDISKSLTKKLCVFVTNGTAITDNQLELAHNSGEEVMRHVIDTTNNYTVADKNTMTFYSWGTELLQTDVATESLLIIYSSDKSDAKTTIPFIDDAFYIGEEEQRWKDIISENSKSELIQSKILKTWNGA